MATRDYDRERRWRTRTYDRDREYDYDEAGYPYTPGSYNRGYPGRRPERGYDYGRRFGAESGYDYGDYESEYTPTWTYTEYWWWMPGQYTGVGPRNYQRSDERIHEEVNDRLMQHGQIDASDIEVEVNDGIVTLNGGVNSRREKRMAEDVAESVAGVWDVHNSLSVRRSEREREWTSGQSWESSRQYQEGSTQFAQGSGQIREGMEVVDRDGDHLGIVKEVRGDEFLLDRPLARDVYVPFSACTFSAGQVQLNVRSDEIGDQGWQQPDLVETRETSYEGR